MILESKSDYYKNIIYLWGIVKSLVQGLFKFIVRYDELFDVDLGSYVKIVKVKNFLLQLMLGKNNILLYQYIGKYIFVFVNELGNWIFKQRRLKV